MAPFTHQDVLAENKRQNDMNLDIDMKRIAAVRAVQTPTPAEVPPVSKLDLSIPSEADPFAGNTNNRNVAKRIAREGRGKQYINAAFPAHTGDSQKAAADVQKSLKANPETVPTPDEFPPIDLGVKPSAGSPAAQKVDEPASTPAPAAPSVWTPNAAR